MNTNTLNKSKELNYFDKRIEQLGLTPEEAKLHALDQDQEGNIIQYFRTYTGNFVQYIPRIGDKARRYKNIQRSKTPREYQEDQFIEYAKITRFSPEYLKSHPKAPKYKFQSKKYTGLEVTPLPTNLAIKNYLNKKQGGTIYVTEGYFKALKASLNGLEFTAFSGITTFKLCEQFKDYLKVRKPDNIVILYDADAQNISTKKKVVSNKRPKAFLSSSYKFAVSLFEFFKLEGISCKVHFCQVKNNEYCKGLDDLFFAQDVLKVVSNFLHHSVNEDNVKSTKEDVIIEALQSLKSSEYFDFIHLYKTKIERQLHQHFSVNNHVKFYNKFKDAIKEEPFFFDGAKYQKKVISRTSEGRPLRTNQLEIGSKQFSYFKLINDPFFVEINQHDILINKYLSEAHTEIKAIREAQKNIAFSSQTGSGKTTYFIEDAIKNNELLVIAVPTILLCKQLGEKYKKHNSFALHGTTTPLKLCKAEAAQVVFCTYDVISKINLQDRTLVIDEAHNLINAFSYRSNAVRDVLEATQRSRQNVLISGTQSKALCKELGFYYVDVKQKEQQKTNVISIESSDTKNAIIQRLQAESWQNNDIKFCYINNTEHLHEIKDYLVKHDVLKDDEIEIITSTDVKQGCDRVYKQIQKTGLIKDVKLILATCILAEGISIHNKNIGNIYTVDINCVDSFKQFTARFRQLDFVNVYAIRHNERRLNQDYLINTTLRIEHLKNEAKVKVDAVNNEREYLLHLEDFDNEDLFYLDQVEPMYNYKSELFRNIYLSSNKRYNIDILSILATERTRKLNGMNNAAFYTELAKHDNIFLQGNEEEAVIDDVKEELKELESDQATRKKEAVLKANFDVKNNHVIFEAAYFNAKKNRSKLAEFISLTFYQNRPPKIQSCKALQYYQDNEEAFLKNWFTPTIKNYLKLYFLDLEESFDVLVDCSTKDVTIFFERLFFLSLESIYNKRSTRKHLSKLHKIELRLLIKFRTLLLTLIEDHETISEAKLLAFTRSSLKQSDLSTEAAKKFLLKFIFFEVVRSKNGTYYKNLKNILDEDFEENCIKKTCKKLFENESNLLKIILLG